MDILAGSKLDLSQFDIDGYLIFTSIDMDDLMQYQEEVERLQAEGKTKEVVQKMLEVVKGSFTKGKIGDEEFDSLGKISANVVKAAFETIVGSNKKK